MTYQKSRMADYVSGAICARMQGLIGFSSFSDVAFGVCDDFVRIVGNVGIRPRLPVLFVVAEDLGPQRIQMLGDVDAGVFPGGDQPVDQRPSPQGFMLAGQEEPDVLVVPHRLGAVVVQEDHVILEQMVVVRKAAGPVDNVRHPAGVDVCSRRTY